MCFFMAVSSMTPVLPAPPAKFLPSLSSARTAKKTHSASSALNQNNYPKKCTAESVRGEGNEAQRLLAITSLQSLLVISLLLWKRTRMAWEEAMCSRQTDRQWKGLMWIRSPKNISHLWSLWQPGSSSGGLAAIRTRLLALCSVCQASSYPHFLKHWTCHSEDVRALKNPQSGQADTFHYKNPAGGWSVWGPVRICEFFLKDFFVRHRGVPIWLQNGFETSSSSKPSNFLKHAADRKTKHWLDSGTHEVSVIWMLWLFCKSTGDWQPSSHDYRCFECLFCSWVVHSSFIQRF